MSRLETMTERIKKDLPEFVELVPPNERSEGLYRRIRHIQKTGECCGFEMSMEQLQKIIALAGRESVRDKVLYLCRVLDRVHVERTLENVSDTWTMDGRLMFAKVELGLLKWQLKYLTDLIRGKYSMDDIITATEIAMKKDHPSSYLIAIFKKGYRKPEDWAKLRRNYS